MKTIQGKINESEVKVVRGRKEIAKIDAYKVALEKRLDMELHKLYQLRKASILEREARLS